MTAYPTKPKPINKGIMIGVASRDNRTRKYFDSADFVLYGVQKHQGEYDALQRAEDAVRRAGEPVAACGATRSNRGA